MTDDELRRLAEAANDYALRYQQEFADRFGRSCGNSIDAMFCVAVQDALRCAHAVPTLLDRLAAYERLVQAMSEALEAIYDGDPEPDTQALAALTAADQLAKGTR